MKTTYVKILAATLMLISLSVRATTPLNLSNEDKLALEFPGLAQSYSSSIQRKNNEGKKIDNFGKKRNKFDPYLESRERKLCSDLDGFSLHAKEEIAAHDRVGLEHLCRYVARPVLSNSRISMDENLNVIYQLKRPYWDGTTHLRFTQEEFIHKLIALVPPPKSNLTRYHGVLGPDQEYLPQRPRPKQ